MTKLGLAPGNGLRTYEQYYDAVEGLPSPLLSVSELRQEAASSSTSRRRSNRTDPDWEAFHDTCTNVKWVLGLSHLLSRDLAGIDWDCSSNGDMAVAARNGSPAAIPLLAAEGPYPFFIVPQRTRDCVALLCQRMCDSITGCVENTRPAVRDDRRMEIAHHVGRTNLLSSIADALTGCKDAMQQLQLQTELQRLPIEQPMWEAATSLVSFAHSVLTLFNGIAAIWPITLLTGEENPMVEAVEPAAELAAAFLKQLSPSATAELAAQASAAKAAAALSAVTSSFAPTADASSSSSSSPSGSNDKLKAALLDAVSAAICTADLLAFRMFQECADEGPPVEPEEKQSRTLLVSNKELQALLLAHLGYITQEMHSSMRGKTAVSAAAMLQPKAAKQQQQQQQQQQRQQPPVLADVELHHRKLLQLVLGVQFIADVSEVSRTPDISPASATNTMFALIYQMQAVLELADPSAAEMSPCGRHTQQQQQLVLPAGTHEPLLLTLVQLMQLVPNTRTAEPLLQLMQFAINTLADMIRQSLGTPASASDVVVHRGSHPVLQHVQALVSPLLLQLGPAVYHAVRVNKRAVARGEEEEEEDGIYDAVIPTFWAGITLTVVNMAEPAAVSVAMAADPRTAAITLEAALRLQHSAITQQLPGALEDEETRSIRIRGRQVDQLMVFAHKVALCASRSDRVTPAAAAAGAVPQLLSLLLTCIKYCGSSSSSEPASSLEGLEVAWLAAKAALQLAPAAASSQPGSSSSSSSDVSSSTHAAVVAARSLQLTAGCFAVVLKDSAALAAADVRIGAEMPAEDRLLRLLQQLSATLGFFSENLQKQQQQQQQQQQQVLELAADRKGAVRQQLQQQLQALQQSVEQAQQRSSSSSSSSAQAGKMVATVKAVLGQESLLQQLQEFSELLCAHLLPQGLQWCNNPSCSNMSGLSEALLAKKRCSACKVARHCCPGCQAAQWPQHKVVCKRLKAAQQQQQA